MPNLPFIKSFISTTLLFILLFSTLWFIPPPVKAQNPPPFPVGINIDPSNPGGNPSPDQLNTVGADTARLVYKANDGGISAAKIEELVNSGINPIIILNQQTLWPKDGIITDAYTAQFSQIAAGLAEQYRDKISLEIWNEPDAHSAASISLSPLQFGSLLSSTYNAVKSVSPGTNVLVGGLVSGNTGYLQEVINILGGLPADGIAVHPYTTSVDAVIQTIEDFTKFGLPVWVTEFGWETPNQTDQANYFNEVMTRLANLGPDKVAAVLWYAWSDAMGAGFGLFDANGNPKEILALFLLWAAGLIQLPPGFNLGLFPVPTLPPPPPPVCGTEPPTIFRPYPYAACTLSPDYSILDQGFATTFAAKQDVELHYTAFSQCSGDDYTHQETWGGIVTVNINEPFLPFAGFGKSDTIPQAETKYLADYFDGTLFYDQNGPPGTIKTIWNFLGFGTPWTRTMFTDGGVFRKLASQDQQDRLRCLMVQRAKGSAARTEKNPVHNYEIKWDKSYLPDFGDILWEATGLEITQSLSEFTCPPDKIGTPAYEAWRKTKSGLLWPFVPVTTRDDYPGTVNLSVQSPPGVLDNPGPYPISVPHMARLEEITKLTRSAVLPQKYQEQVSVASTENQPSASSIRPGTEEASDKTNLLASSETVSTGSQGQVLSTQTSSPKLLAQASDFPPDDNCGITVDPNDNFFVKAYNPRRNECGILADVTHLTTSYSVDGSPPFVACDHGENLAYEFGILGTPTNISQIWGGECAYKGPPPQNRFTVTISFDNATGAWNCDKHVTISTTLTKDANGNWVPSCGQIPIGPPVPQCENPDFYTPPDRDEEAIEDKANEPNLDHMRKNPVQTHLQVDGYTITMDTSEWEKWRECATNCRGLLSSEARDVCCSQVSCCSPTRTFTMSRKIGTDVWLPYMERVRNQTSYLKTGGLFRIFAPAQLAKFKDLYAKDQISFAFSPGWADPNEGWLYFPFLGGIQKAKECLVNQILCPLKINGVNCTTAECPSSL